MQFMTCCSIVPVELPLSLDVILRILEFFFWSQCYRWVELSQFCQRVGIDYVVIHGSLEDKVDWAALGMF